MIDLLSESAFLDNEEKFEAEFGPPSVDEDEEKEDDEKEEMKRQRRKSVMKQKGQEWNDLFGDEANDDDDFKIGMSLNPNVVKTKGKKKRVAAENGAAGSSAGVAVKLFTEFYKSDIILASPIGLKMATTKTEGEDDEEAAASDVDFLSSIDICIVARSDVLAMQNWDHVNSILECLNQQPKNTSNIDFSRVRNYFLEGQGENWRQLIMVSKFADPFILSSFRRYGKNIEGQLKLRRQTPDDDADVTNVTVHVKQVFQRVSCESVSQVGSSRLRYFSEHVLPKLMRLKQKHTLIFIPSYFDFVSVRNLLLKQEASFVSVTEYARVSEISRGRARFHQGRKDIMLYTGRAHFFLRHKIKGVRHVIFFGLPEYAEFYSSIINMLDGGLSELEEDVVTRMPLSCLSLFTRYEAHQLERIVGTGNANKMIKGEKSSYLFAT
jgi:U3 small nucleolar RNA-associated protein 25